MNTNRFSRFAVFSCLLLAACSSLPLWAPDATPYVSLGLENKQKGEYDSAIQNFEKARQIEPENQQIRQLLFSALLEAARYHNGRKDYSGSLNYLKKAATVNPSDTTVPLYIEKTEQAIAAVSAPARPVVSTPVSTPTPAAVTTPAAPPAPAAPSPTHFRKVESPPVQKPSAPPKKIVKPKKPAQAQTPPAVAPVEEKPPPLLAQPPGEPLRQPIGLSLWAGLSTLGLLALAAYIFMMRRKLSLKLASLSTAETRVQKEAEGRIHEMVEKNEQTLQTEIFERRRKSIEAVDQETDALRRQKEREIQERWEREMVSLRGKLERVSHEEEEKLTTELHAKYRQKEQEIESRVTALASEEALRKGQIEEVVKRERLRLEEELGTTRRAEEAKLKEVLDRRAAEESEARFSLETRMRKEEAQARRELEKRISAEEARLRELSERRVIEEKRIVEELSRLRETENAKILAEMLRRREEEERKVQGLIQQRLQEEKTLEESLKAISHEGNQKIQEELAFKRQEEERKLMEVMQRRLEEEKMLAEIQVQREKIPPPAFAMPQETASPSAQESFGAEESPVSYNLFAAQESLTSTARLLADLDSGLASETFQSLASSPDHLERLAVTWALSEVGSESTLDLLCGLGQDEHPEVRGAARGILARLSRGRHFGRMPLSPAHLQKIQMALRGAH